MAVSKFARAASICLLLAASCRAGASIEPTGEDILKASQKAYDALTSYSDQSTAESDMMEEHSEASYTTRLLRPNLYKIEWTGTSASAPKNSGPIKGVCRTDGTASLLAIGFADSPHAMPPMRSPDLKTSLGLLAFAGLPPIGCDVPGTFFSRETSSLTRFLSTNPRTKTTISRQSDEKIGPTDCFVITITVVREGKGPSGQTRDFQDTSQLSIGKQDFLIRRWRENFPWIGGKETMTWTFTHRDVEVNPHLSPDDFAH